MEIAISELSAMTNELLDHILELGVDKVELSADFYWDIVQEQRYDKADEPSSFTVGQLSEDLTFLEEMRAGIRPPISYGLVWLSSLLRYVGESVLG